MDASLIVKQTLATCNNYLHTGRPNKAVKLLEVVKRIAPDNPAMKEMFQYISSRILGVSMPDMLEFGANWRGEDLDGKSIEVFCDQGMGDTINVLRYLHVMKERWPKCRIVLNNYAFYYAFQGLLEQVDAIDEIASEHIKCDYHTNILCLPSLLNGLDLEEHYPTPWQEVLKTPIPQQPLLSAKEVTKSPDRPCAGVSWRSNPSNVLSKLKSIPDQEIEILKQSGVKIYSLMPLHNSVLAPIETLADTAAMIAAMDVVVSVDTVVLHLAGAMGKTTFGLLPKMADPRWADGETTVWYPSVRLFRQTTDGDWTEPLNKVKDELASLT